MGCQTFYVAARHFGFYPPAIKCFWYLSDCRSGTFWAPHSTRLNQAGPASHRVDPGYRNGSSGCRRQRQHAARVDLGSGSQRQIRVLLRRDVGAWPRDPGGVRQLLRRVGLGLIVWGFARYRATGWIDVWYPPVAMKHITVALMLPAVIMVVASYIRGRIYTTLKHMRDGGTVAWALDALAYLDACRQSGLPEAARRTLGAGQLHAVDEQGDRHRGAGQPDRDAAVRENGRRAREDGAGRRRGDGLLRACRLGGRGEPADLRPRDRRAHRRS